MHGMCGGPVCSQIQIERKPIDCFGMVEGIIPDTHPEPKFRGLASFIESAEIKK